MTHGPQVPNSRGLQFVFDYFFDLMHLNPSTPGASFLNGFEWFWKNQDCFRNVHACAHSPSLTKQVYDSRSYIYRIYIGSQQIPPFPPRGIENETEQIK